MALVPKRTKLREVQADDMENFLNIDIFNFLFIKVKIVFILPQLVNNDKAMLKLILNSEAIDSLETHDCSFSDSYSSVFTSRFRRFENFKFVP